MPCSLRSCAPVEPSRQRPDCCSWMRKVSAGLLGARSRCRHRVSGYVEGVTHDSKRHGTTTLFAARTCRTAPRSRIASRCTGLIHLLSLCVVSREMSYSKYWERTRVSGESRDDTYGKPRWGKV